MSQPTSTSTRTPLKDVSLSLLYNSKTGTPHHQPMRPTGCTPKTSPGPALLHGIRLSAKKNLLKLSSHSANTDGGVTKLEDSAHKLEASLKVKPFRNLLLSETDRISQICCYWDKILQDDASLESTSSDVPGDFVLGEIRTTIGQARLIMKERFHQFEGLVDNCEFQSSEKAVTCEDLQGFWDMIYFQVEDVDKKFASLKNCQSCNWNESSLMPAKEPLPVIKPKKKILNKPFRAKSAAVKARNEEIAKKRAEARKRLQAAKAEMKKAHCQSDQKTFDAGPFFKIESPLKSPRKKVDHVNTSFEYFANKSDVVVTGPLSENIPKAASVDIVQSPPKLNQPTVIVNESPAQKSTEEESSTHHCAIQETLKQKSPASHQNISGLVVIDSAMLCPTPVDASGDGFTSTCAANTPKNISRLLILSANASPWSNISMSEIEPQTTTSHSQNFDTDESASNVRSSNNSFNVGTPSNATQNLQSHHVTLPEVQHEETDAIGTHCAQNPPTACSSSQYHEDRKQEVHTPLTPFRKDGLDVSMLIDTAAKNIEMASELLNETPQRQVKDIRARSLVDQDTSSSPQGAKNERSMAEALQKILKHMAIFQDLSEHHIAKSKPAGDQKDAIIEQMHEEIKELKIKNAELLKKASEPLTCEEVVQYLYDTTEMPETADISYKPHYLRLLTKVKMLQIRESKYDECRELLEEKAAQLEILVDHLDMRKKEVVAKELEITELAAKCKEKEITENEELERNRIELSELKLKVAEKEEIMVDMAAQIEQQIPLIKELKERNEFLETESSNVKQEILDQTNRIRNLHADFAELKEMYGKETKRADDFQNKFELMNEEVYSTFQQFEATLEERNKTVAQQEKKLEEICSANAILQQTCRQLKDRVETLEYVEDEMRSLQEQLLETENILASSKLNEEQANKKVCELEDILAQRDCEVETLKKNGTSLQERCDVVQTEADFSVQKSKEELLDGIAGVDHIVEQMNNFLSRLKSAANGSFGNAIEMNQRETLTRIQAPMVKDENSMSWKVDYAVSVFSSIIKECFELNWKFQKDIEKLEGEKLACRKQIDDMRMALSDGARKENELEEILRKRISNLSKECEEKTTKLEDQVEAMRVLSDQNLELLEYKMHHQGMVDGLRGYGRRSIPKRRSLSSNR